MGKHFGNLQKLKGVIYYSLSPMELRPFAKILNPGLQNVFRRIWGAVAPAIIPFTLGYLVYDWAKHEHHRTMRKNPDDYKDDV